eukprot:1158986-Pelagomonas_calceolata.AAC.1
MCGNHSAVKEENLTTKGCTVAYFCLHLSLPIQLAHPLCSKCKASVLQRAGAAFLVDVMNLTHALTPTATPPSHPCICMHTPACSGCLGCTCMHASMGACMGAVAALSACMHGCSGCLGCTCMGAVAALSACMHAWV